ncbi:helix-turn-helix domain-containing protein [Nocardioides albertanoniae]|uniref:helix-turn-helix domain-containing protein n=1 Tax=Nocardioides albertanoniae TaxID=1175486 RepID=UPI001B87689A|nr:helix-turn-helix domain-containing protein [Nocardioides albertanoniae]
MVEDSGAALDPLEKIKPHSRWVLGETLEVMLHNGIDRPADVAARLELPPSTAAYRVRLLRELFGQDLNDPGPRLAMMRALRTALPRWTAEAAYAKRRRSTRSQSTCC